MRRKRVHVLVTLGMVLLNVLSPSPPVAASDVHTITAELHRGRTDFVTAIGTINIDRPDSGVPGCTESFTISADFDYKTRSMSLTGYHRKMPFVLSLFGGNYQLETTGVVRSGAATWNHDGDHSFGPITERLDFVIQSFNPTGCVKGTTVCDGTVEMSFSGELRNARDAFPDIYLRGTTVEALSIRQPCSGIWGAILPGSTVRVEQVPNSGDPDAWFRRI